MKKLALYIMTFALALSLVGCAGKKSSEELSDRLDDVIDAIDEKIDSQEEDTVVSDVENTLPSEDEESEDETEIVAEAPLEDEYEDYADLYFETYDIFGDYVCSDDFYGAKLIILNFWEPWCGPCVGEMPDIAKLYEKYKEDGLVVIGAFGTEGMDEDVIDIMESCGTGYPIVWSTESMSPFMTEYVPTTVLFDGKWHIISEEPIIGSMDYNSWESLIREYLY